MLLEAKCKLPTGFVPERKTNIKSRKFENQSLLKTFDISSASEKEMPKEEKKTREGKEEPQSSVFYGSNTGHLR